MTTCGASTESRKRSAASFSRRRVDGGRLRGLLCNRCNAALGNIGDTYDEIAASVFASPTILAYARGPAGSSLPELIAWYQAGGPRADRR